ncbi:hypothetical protein P9112_000243 [Eukaryota sp. TZLM1-RC]
MPVSLSLSEFICQTKLISVELRGKGGLQLVIDELPPSVNCISLAAESIEFSIQADLSRIKTLHISDCQRLSGADQIQFLQPLKLARSEFEDLCQLVYENTYLTHLHLLEVGAK